MKKLLLIVLAFIFFNCEGNIQDYSPTEKILTLSIENDVNSITFNDNVIISAFIEVNVEALERAEIGFNGDLGQFFYNGIEYFSGDSFLLDTTGDIIFTYVPVFNTDIALQNNSLHKVSVTITNSDDTDNYSSDTVSFRIQ